MGQLAQSCPSNHDESDWPHVWNQIQRQEHYKLDNLNDAPRLVYRCRRRLAEHLDRVGRVCEQEPVRRDKVNQRLLDQCSLRYWSVKEA